MNRPSPYIPALNQEWLTPLYDPILRWLFRERALKHQLVEQAQLRPDDRVL